MKQKKDLKFFVIIGLLLFSCLVSWRLYFKVYRQKDKVNIHLFPKSFGNWTSSELIITEDEYAILETRNAFVRKYSNTDGREVYLFIVYSESNRKVSHPPEVCYIGSGVSVLSNTPNFITLEGQNMLMKTNRLKLEQGRSAQVAYYWFKIADLYTASYWKQQMLIVFKTLLGSPPSSALIRVSTTITEDRDEELADQQVQEFIKEVVPYLQEYLP